MNLKIKVLIGLPASGKTTWAIQFIQKNIDWVIVSRDDLRYAWKNSGYTEHKIEETITEVVDYSIKSLLRRKQNIIYDATNTKLSYINKFVNKFKHAADIEFMVFSTPLETCLERNSNRERKVSDDVIVSMNENLMILFDSFDFNPIQKQQLKYIKPIFDESKTNAIIVDIDGTLAHINDNRSPYDFTRVKNDITDEVIKNIVNSYNGKVIIVSGRDESCRKDTIKWLNDNSIKYNELFMRNVLDNRKDSIIKEEIFWNNIAPFFNIEYVLDDRDQVVKMWRSLGLKCLQVQEGNF